MSTPDTKPEVAPESSPPQPPAPRPGRRALTLAVVVGSCAVAAAAVIPVTAFVASPVGSKGAGGRWVRTLRLDQLVEGEPKRVAIVDDRRDAWTVERGVELGSVWLVKQGGKVTALSAVCPHLGCSVNVVTGGGQPAGFACPCHTSAFDGDGKRRSGPSPRDMDALGTRIEDGGVVAVDFRRFRIGIPEKVEA
jgi:cytochrome b6-f complex iron-sulfur subunit/menaquinol-cytochrome c reductase iron-sulfur subunit